jgi:hypothetical protein
VANSIASLNAITTVYMAIIAYRFEHIKSCVNVYLQLLSHCNQGAYRGVRFAKWPFCFSAPKRKYFPRFNQFILRKRNKPLPGKSYFETVQLRYIELQCW